MSPTLRWLPALALLSVPPAWGAGDYVGLLRPTRTAIAIPEPGFYWPGAEPFGSAPGLAPGPDGFRLKLGYRYSRFLSVETGVTGAGWDASGPSLSLVPSRATGFSMDTIGTVPLWTHGSLYGRFGAWRSDGGASLIATGDASPRRGAGLRYGLGLKYDLTRRIGVQAEMERFSPLDRWGAREPDTDQVSVGISWKF